ncbi:hypothetical protein HDV01_001614 [Terramyces sp. JEL0728]|nr:hypothetical protein HDV01_001614 [Terramyces sp. JEL0728]
MKSHITTHVLDTSNGCAAKDVNISLYYYDSNWTLLGSGKTNTDGRIQTLLLENGQPKPLQKGLYKLTFDIKSYYSKYGVEPFFPAAEVQFQVQDVDRHYHVPLVITPFAYNTYRGT